MFTLCLNYQLRIFRKENGFTWKNARNRRYCCITERRQYFRIKTYFASFLFLRGKNLQWAPFFFLLMLKSYWLYNIPDAMQILVVTSLSVYRLHNARDHAFSSMPPAQFMRHFRREHLHSVYFKYPVLLLIIFIQPGSDVHCCIDRC